MSSRFGTDGRKKLHHILVAEDEANLISSFKFILSAAGYKTTIARNGKDALTRLQNSILTHDEFDLLITDIAMPEMNGEELIDAIGKLAIKIPVLVVTGYGDKQLLIRLMRRGCRDFIEKPMPPETLEQRVAAIFNQIDKECSEEKQRKHLALLGERSQSLVHDLNNIVGGILGYSDIVMNDVEMSHPAYEYAAKLFTTARTAAEICSSFLNIDPDAPLSLKTKTEIRTLVEKISVVCKAIAPDKVEILVVAPPEPVWLNADPDGIQQALLNLGVNAIDAVHGQGRIVFTVAVEDAVNAGEEGCRSVCITVSDTGEGISNESIKKLFVERFSTKTNGNGIGFPTVKRIVDEHKGAIRVTSDPETGTAFILSFPITRVTDRKHTTTVLSEEVPSGHDTG